MPQRRRLSSRYARGRGWHKKGYREHGNLFLQLKRSYANFSRTCQVNENETIANFIWEMLRKCDFFEGHAIANFYSLLVEFDLGTENPGTPPEGLHFVFFFRRQVLVPSEAMVKTLFDGGETLYVKVSNAYSAFLDECSVAHSRSR